MARRRKHDRHLPPRVYRTSSGNYAYYPPSGGSKTIAKAGASLVQIEKALEEYKADINPTGLLYLKQRYHESTQFRRLAKVTQEDYEQASVKPLQVFKNTDCTQVRPEHIRRYMDKRGQVSEVRANRELAWLHNVFAYAFERGLVRINPCLKIKKFPEEARKRYVTDEEYQAMLEIASPVVKVAMEIAYCTGLRQTDILDLRWSQVQAGGIPVKLSKTGVDMVKEYSPRLQDALRAAKELPGVLGMHVISNRRGSGYTRSGFGSLWTKSASKLPPEQRFQFRDLRRKAVTDYEGVKKDFSGHKTDAMVARYNVKPIRSPSL